MTMTDRELEIRFTYHPPRPGQVETYNDIRSAFRQMATFLNDTLPDSREKSLAFTKLEEAVMHANSSIARETTRLQDAASD
jgi:hypothetical protein